MISFISFRFEDWDSESRAKHDFYIHIFFKLKQFVQIGNVFKKK